MTDLKHETCNYSHFSLDNFHKTSNYLTSDSDIGNDSELTTTSDSEKYEVGNLIYDETGRKAL